MTSIHQLDTVALLRSCRQWALGTTGAVLEIFDEEAALVELVGPDGRSLDVLTVSFDDLNVVSSFRNRKPAELTDRQKAIV